ncbi:MAG TPA: hypothetical protein VIW68_14100 [Candidatus Sulfotelmatobacter sp.]
MGIRFGLRGLPPAPAMHSWHWTATTTGKSITAYSTGWAPKFRRSGDGIIDKNDAIFSKLLLFPDLGVYSINLRYRDDRHYFDQYGNWFHYQASLNPDPLDGESKDGRMTYDVFFVTVKSPSAMARPMVWNSITASKAWDRIAEADHRLR